MANLELPQKKCFVACLDQFLLLLFFIKMVMINFFFCGLSFFSDLMIETRKDPRVRVVTDPIQVRKFHQSIWNRAKEGENSSPRLTSSARVRLTNIQKYRSDKKHRRKQEQKQQQSALACSYTRAEASSTSLVEPMTYRKHGIGYLIKQSSLHRSESILYL